MKFFILQIEKLSHRLGDLLQVTPGVVARAEIRTQAAWLTLAPSIQSSRPTAHLTASAPTPGLHSPTC